jgi:hypothetical protein
MVQSTPPRPETFALLLDATHRGHTIVCVDRAHTADDAWRVAEYVFEAAAGSARTSAVVLASMRQGPLVEHGEECCFYELRHSADERGIELLDWLLVGPTDFVSMALRCDVRSLWLG